MASEEVQAEGAGKLPLPPKPWKQRQSSAEGQKEVVEIFESKVQNYRRSSAVKPTPVGTGYTRVQSGDGANFIVPIVVLEEAEQVKLMFNMDASFKEKLEKVVQFQEIRGEVLEVVLRFCFEEYLNKAQVEQLYGASGPRPRLAFHFEVDPALAMEIISAAHFLGLKELLQLASAMVAHHLTDVPDVSTLPKDLAWVVAQHLSADALLEAEDREDFQAIGLDTNDLWEKHCRSRDWTGATSLGLLLQSDLASISLFDASAPDLWKRVYVTHDLHFASALQTKESFPAFLDRLRRWGKFVTFQMVGRALYKDVLLPHFRTEALVRYALFFPTLKWLVLSQIDGGAQTEAENPNFNLGALILALPSLQVFDARFARTDWKDLNEVRRALEHLPNLPWRLGPVEIEALSMGIAEHKSLAVLRLSYNPTWNELMWKILKALRNSSLKVLDLGWCEIQSCSAPLDVLAGLRESGLEALVLSGNPFGKPVWVNKPADMPPEEGSWRIVNGILRKTVSNPPPRRTQKAPARKPPTTNVPTRKRGPKKRPEWVSYFDDNESEGGAGPSNSHAPEDDQPGTSSTELEGGQNPGDGEPGCSAPEGEGNESLEDVDPGRLLRPVIEKASGSSWKIRGSQSSGFGEPSRSSGFGVPRQPPVIQKPSGSSSRSGPSQSPVNAELVKASWGLSELPVDDAPGTSSGGVGERQGLNGKSRSCLAREASEEDRLDPGSGDSVPGLSSLTIGGQFNEISRAERSPSPAGGRIIEASSSVPATANRVPPLSPRNAEPSDENKTALGDGSPKTLTDVKGKGKIDDCPQPPVQIPSFKSLPKSGSLRTEVADGAPTELASLSLTNPPLPTNVKLTAEAPTKPSNPSLDEHIPPTIEKFGVQPRNEPDPIIMGSILTALPTSLRKLALFDCGLGDVHVPQLVRGLTDGKCPLEELDLSHNEITARGAGGVFTWLQENDSLLQLSLASNKITSTCIDELVTALRVHRKLLKLSLAGNFSFGEERVPDVLEAACEHAGLLSSLDEGALFCVDLSFIDVTFGARRRFLDTYEAYTNLKLVIRG